MSRQLLETDQKALEINLNNSIYGTFAEIGAGQEVARHFFQVGAAAGTIAKTMSAYDKVVSDKIYGLEKSGRYVCEPRLYKMLDHEYVLMSDRLRQQRPDTRFFVFANSVAAVNYTRTIKGNGWLGVRFQLNPDSEPNDLVLHVKMKDKDNTLQQQAIGILGVNMIYACYKYYKEPETMLQSLIDGLHGRVEIDMVRLTGPDFTDLDNRLLSLYLIRNKICKVTMFGKDKAPIHGSEFLYRKNPLLVRGSFRPITHVNWDMIHSGTEQFRENLEHPNKLYQLTEITLENLNRATELDEIDEADFLQRADLLAELDQTVVLTQLEDQTELIKYLKDFKVEEVGIVIGVRDLMNIVHQKYDSAKSRNHLETFGKLFKKNASFFVYPAFQEGSSEIMNSDNMPVPEEIKFLFKYLKEIRQIVDIQNYNQDILHIFSWRVLQKIKNDEAGWEQEVPQKVADLIKKEKLFGYPIKHIEFKY